MVIKFQMFDGLERRINSLNIDRETFAATSNICRGMNKLTEWKLYECGSSSTRTTRPNRIWTVICRALLRNVDYLLVVAPSVDMLANRRFID